MTRNGEAVKVKKVWECECGTSKLLVRPEDSKSIIIKGDAFQLTEPLSRAITIVCRVCLDKHYLLKPIVIANELRKRWLCRCGETKLLESESGSYLVQGMGFPYGDPPTQIRCGGCGDSYRIAPAIVWASHLALKQQKRNRGKANRRARRKRRRA